MKIERRNIDNRTPYSSDSHSNRAAVEVVTNSIRDFGFRRPIVIDDNCAIVAGQARYGGAGKDLDHPHERDGRGGTDR